uniref:uncharacterized protein LOC100183141 isoform X3 n=1 Tax=Ciona intestinalis TaxID=7719 RepID=UPI00089DA9DA|nr:uncharacterized protein LOC100183141 isoform X3 [Ciona intestinalis]|eukprot:XP_018668784.1 uncharacterized protein LOC100183141 isoform X3 [Ciona intestinalis]
MFYALEKCWLFWLISVSVFIHKSWCSPTLISLHHVPEQSVECVHGKYDELERCVCNSEWTGENCDVELTSFDNFVFADVRKPTTTTDGYNLFDVADINDLNAEIVNLVVNFDSWNSFNDQRKMSKDVLDENQNDFDVQPSVNEGSSSGFGNSGSGFGNEDVRKNKDTLITSINNKGRTSFVRSETNKSLVEQPVQQTSSQWINYESSSSGSGSETLEPEIYDEGGLMDCGNGTVKKIFQHCACEPNFTGQFCEIDLLESSGESSTFNLDYSGSGVSEKICYHGVPVFIKHCECHFGFEGVSCQLRKYLGSGDWNILFNTQQEIPDANTTSNPSEDILWNASNFDNLTWTRVTNYLNPNNKLAKSKHIFGRKFVVISTGIKKTKTVLDYSPSPSEDEPNIYRFSFVPKKSGGKSRLELNTCFVKKRDASRLFGTDDIDDNIMSQLITHCPITKRPTTALHTYAYDLYLPREDFPEQGQYILTQWHGSPNPNILKDEYGCVAQISSFDKARLCRAGSCSQGEIFDKDGLHIGLLYQQGGYPPLALEYQNGWFIVSARSDEHSMAGKVGCSVGQKVPPHFHCPKHDRQQFSEILRMPAQEFPFNTWARFEWKIKWSEYDVVYERNRTTVDGDPGHMTSQAWIRLWINGRKVIDWIGACGRNDEGRLPYFKIGIYNPTGSSFPLRMYVRGYEHTYTQPDAKVDDNEKDILSKLKLVDHKLKKEISRNSFINGMRFIHVGGDGRCVLRAKLNHVSHITRTKFRQLKVDKKTQNLIKSMVYAIEQQEFRIKQLERLVQERCLTPLPRNVDEAMNNAGDIDED